MARGKKKKVPIVRLEMRWGGLFSFAVVSFCLMLWMFLFGIWTGQSVLQRPYKFGADSDLVHEDRTIKNVQVKRPVVPLEIVNKQSLPKKPLRKILAPLASKKDVKILKQDVKDVASFYAIQIGAFRDVSKARAVVVQWRAREYEAFYLLPPIGSRFNRVFVGHVAGLPAVKKMAKSLEDSLKSKVFITLIAGDARRYPPD